MAEFSNPLINSEDLLTQGGATLAVTVVTNGIEYLFGLNPKYVGFVTSLIVVFAGTGSDIFADFSVLKIIIALVNTFFVYSGAVGITSITTPHKNKLNQSITAGETPPNPEEIGKARKRKRIFWKPWY